MAAGGAHRHARPGPARRQLALLIQLQHGACGQALDRPENGILPRGDRLDGRLELMSDPSVVARLIGPSVSLAGLLLVFTGFLLARAKDLGGTARLSKPFRTMARWGLAPVGLALLSSALGVLELSCGVRLVPVEIVFLAALVSVFVYAFVALFRL